MKALILTALLGTLTLTACAGVTPILPIIPVNPAPPAGVVTTDVTGCVAALIGSGSTDPVALAVTAGTTAACWDLAGDALGLAVKLATTHNIRLQEIQADQRAAARHG